LEGTQGFLRGIETSLQESYSRSKEPLEDICERSTSSILVDTQIYHSVTLLGDVDDLAEEHQLMEDTSICVLRVGYFHIEVDPAIRLGYTMQQESTGDDMSMSKHIVVKNSSQGHAKMYGGIQRVVLPCREETHLGEHADATPWQQHIVIIPHLHHFSSGMREERWILVHQQIEESRLVVLDDWGLVMTTGEQLSWVLVDVVLVESLGVNNTGGIFQSYGQLQMFLLSFPNAFIMGNNMRRDWSWLRTWGVARPKPPDNSIFTTSNRIEVDRHRKIVEAWCMMVSIMGPMIVDEHIGLMTMINLTHE
jgi:hypothetical protein